MKEILLSNINNILVNAENYLPKILAGIIIVLIVMAVGKLTVKIVRNILVKAKIPEINLDLYLKIIKIFFLFIAAILFLGAVGLKSLATGLFAGGGVIAVVSGFALREIGENIFAGILLSINRPFKKGDLIKSGDFEGIVKAIEIRSTHIRSYDGQDIFIPSAQIYKNALINYTKDGLRRFTLNIGISYENDIKLACKIIGDEFKNIKGIIKIPKASVAATSLLPNYVELTAYYWIDVFSGNSNVGDITTNLASNIKEGLLSGGFTLSSDISSNINFRVAQDFSFNDTMAH